MSNTVVQKALWHLMSAKWIDTDPDCDVMAVVVAGNRTEYAVCVSGPKNLKTNEIIDALRAAAAGLIQVTGGDVSVVGCESPGAQGDLFDTGTQRPS